MLASVYIYGHLVAATFSLAMALAFGVSGARVPGARADHWFVVTFGLTATTALAEMALTLRPSLAMARGYLVLEGVLLFAVTLAFHMRYAHDAFDARGVVRHRRGVWAYAAATVFVVSLVLSGVADHGRTVAVSRLGVHAEVIWLEPWAFVVFLIFSWTTSALLAPVLLARGTNAAERRMIAGPLLFIPAISLHELLIAVGALKTLPLGGYFAAMTGTVGAWVLAERFRTLQSGTAIGRYTIEKRLGGGGMADVYLARRTGSTPGLVQRVALKRLRPEYVGDAAFARMFLDEARIVARLAHPNIVTLLDVGEHGGELYLAMELIEGAPLSRLLRWARGQMRLPAAAAVVEIGIQIADALAYAHERAGDDGRPLELVHRDVSPHNILVDGAGHVKLADFGIARSSDRGARTMTGVMKGKISYMAPEQVTSTRYDHRVDLYALGVVLYEMLSGRAAYDGLDEPNVLRLLVDGDPEPARAAEALPAPLGPIVRRALAPDPLARTSSARELLAALEPLRDESAGRAELASLVQATLQATRAQDEAPTIVDVAR